MVTTVGFQEGTIKTAKGRGIALVLLTKENQKGELEFIVNAAASPKQPLPNERFWQGNLRGPLDYFDGDLRFESMGQFLSFLVMRREK